MIPVSLYPRGKRLQKGFSFFIILAAMTILSPLEDAALFSVASSSYSPSCHVHACELCVIARYIKLW